ncbi:hypothetical protein J7E97_18060 [Streptomyces sp. ISL-66]|uniref:hypothetical protein n=1 Tax=Streptomyces sp. ISL-66 TaxID=2819186 RepID=UPI001BECF5EF|nr:hypothetical protein [Streptomyces sp. ISL-66]MBT2469728.1 hypothetical protein [Streptomyces sp. ISL-66]
MASSNLAADSLTAVSIAAVAAVVGALFGALGAFLAARYTSRGTVGAAARTGADAYGKAVRETRMDACTSFASAVRVMISGLQDQANAVYVHGQSHGSDSQQPLPTSAEVLALGELIGEDAVRVRIAGPKVVAEEAYKVLDKCTDLVGDLSEYIRLTASSPFSVDNPELAIIMVDGPIVRHREVMVSMMAASNALAVFLDVARDHLDDWNGQAA